MFIHPQSRAQSSSDRSRDRRLARRPSRAPTTDSRRDARVGLVSKTPPDSVKNMSQHEDVPTAFTSRAREDVGGRRVRSSVVLVHTRFGLRSPRDLLACYRDYSEVARLAHASGELLLSCFLIENINTFHSLSFWDEPAAVARFGTKVPEHVDVARNAFGRLRFDQLRGPELWSARWRLDSASNNFLWPGLNLEVERLDR